MPETLLLLETRSWSPFAQKQVQKYETEIFQAWGVCQKQNYFH